MRRKTVGNKVVSVLLAGALAASLTACGGNTANTGADAGNNAADAGTKEEIDKHGLNLIGVVPQDEGVYDFDCDGKAIVDLPEDSPVKKALKEIVDKLGL
mgnify:CR=1 FL=1